MSLESGGQMAVKLTYVLPSMIFIGMFSQFQGFMGQKYAYTSLAGER